MTGRVAVSILNYNDAEATVACVQSLLDSDRDGYALDVYVTDNCSEAGDRCLLKKSLAGLPRVSLHTNTKNRGFSAGHNGNLRAIFGGSRPDYVWVLNNDCLVARDALLKLIRCAKRRPDVGIWGATLLEPDGNTIQCAGGCVYNSWISSYRQHGQGRALVSVEQLEAIEFDYIAGASMFFPVAVLQTGLRPVATTQDDRAAGQEQWLNEHFFLYFEELDLALRLDPDYKMAWCRAARVKHSGGGGTGANARQRTALAEYHSTLSALKFTRIHYRQRLWLVMPVRYLAKISQLVLQGDFSLIGPLTRAYRDFLSGCS